MLSESTQSIIDWCSLPEIVDYPTPERPAVQPTLRMQELEREKNALSEEWGRVWYAYDALRTDRQVIEEYTDVQQKITALKDLHSRRCELLEAMEENNAKMRANRDAYYAEEAFARLHPEEAAQADDAAEVLLMAAEVR